MLYTDSGEYPLMDVRSIVFETNPDEIEADSRTESEAGTGETLG
jgi:hypothetical protein